MGIGQVLSGPSIQKESPLCLALRVRGGMRSGDKTLTGVTIALDTEAAAQQRNGRGAAPVRAARRPRDARRTARPAMASRVTYVETLVLSRVCLSVRMCLAMALHLQILEVARS